MSRASGIALLAALTAMLAGCAGDLVGPASSLRIVAPATELPVGGTLQLQVLLGGELLLPGAVEWLSRDPSTATVRDGVVEGRFPGTAWVLAVRRNAVDSIQLAVRFADLEEGQTGIRSGTDLLRLTGLAILAQDTTSGVASFHTAILASSGEPRDLPDGRCCQLSGDTLLQLNYNGRPVVGARTLTPGEVWIDPSTGMLWHTGPDDLLLMVRQGGFAMRFHFPVRPSTLHIEEVVEPTLEVPGRIRGWMSFEAAGILHQWDLEGNDSYAAIGDRTTTIYAEFDTPLMLRYYATPVPSPGTTVRP